jgi:hypothetical protein
VIESWPKPNYVNPVTQGPALIYLCIILSSLGLAIVTARTYARIFITKAPGIDDLLILVAAGFSITLSILIIFQQKFWYTGYHIWDVPIDKFAGQRKNVYICEWCYLTATCTVKISILLFYRRLSVTFSKTFLIATWVGIVYNVLYFLTFAICLLTTFKPVNSYWLSFDPTWAATHKYSRGPEDATLPASAALSVVGDFYSTVLPLMLIRFLDLPRRQNAALYPLFALGFLVVAAGVARTISLNRVLNKTYDNTWALWENWIWTVLELNFAILAASGPALKPFFRRFLLHQMTGSERRAPQIHVSRRRSFACKVWDGRRFNWSNTNTARNSRVHVDEEKIGIALTAPQFREDMIEGQIDDRTSTRRYQLHTSRDGRKVPVQIHEQSSLDAESLHTAKSSDPILKRGKAENFDHFPERNEYQSDRDTSPLPKEQQQYHLRDLGLRQPRPQSRPPTQTSGGLEIQPSFHPVPSQPSGIFSLNTGSVAVDQARAKAQQQHLQDFRPGDSTHTHTRSISRGSEPNFSLPSTTLAGDSPYRNAFPERDRGTDGSKTGGLRYAL